MPMIFWYDEEMKGKLARGGAYNSVNGDDLAEDDAEEGNRK